MIAFLKKLLPFLPRLFDWVGGRDNIEIEKIHAQRDLEDAEAFRQGRVSPRYLAKYCGVIIFTLFALAVLIDGVWPGLLPGSPIEALTHLGSQGIELLTSIFNM